MKDKLDANIYKTGVYCSICGTQLKPSIKRKLDDNLLIVGYLPCKYHKISKVVYENPKIKENEKNIAKDLFNELKLNFPDIELIEIIPNVYEKDIFIKIKILETKNIYYLRNLARTLQEEILRDYDYDIMVHIDGGLPKITYYEHIFHRNW